MGSENSGRSISNKSHERYICWEESRQKFGIWVPYKGKQKNIGRFEKLSDAIECRDKWLSEKGE